MAETMPYCHADSAALRELREFWEHWGFVPWDSPPFAGVSRLQRFVKNGILGRIAEFQAMDYIVLEGGTEEEREKLWRKRGPLPEIMTQRFLFLLENPWPERRIRSFALGFKGYLEFYSYRPGGEGNFKARDLTGLVDLGLDLLKKTPPGPPAGKAGITEGI
jgi:hypothetical protein